ncbi:conserved protein of unknown function [Petrocella atlantisensis]|uniref:D-glucuronyl C5-epimerase C-terminal domain-containing protein n=1 Tax=Petrocella atlantisensis TaxID=2173034 RepID=A0A3P7P0I9_9FIRM|nr:hypothetical protein [Petrocella atlantisensis]VDN46990.1 conserved protein of unknown function [Petrocella atlantisensis]
MKTINICKHFSIIIIWIILLIGFMPHTTYTSLAVDEKAVPVTTIIQDALQQNANGDFIWTLPDKLSDIFTPMLTIHPNYLLELDENNITMDDDVMMTTYNYPIVVVEKESEIPVAFLDIQFRHFLNGDLSYHLSLSQASEDAPLLDTGADLINPPLLEDLGLTWTIFESFDSTEDTSHIRIDDLYQITYADTIDNTTSKWTPLIKTDFQQPAAARSDAIVLPKTAVFSSQMRFGMVDVYTLLDANVIIENLGLSPTNLLTKSTGGRKWIARLPLPKSITHKALTEHWGIMSLNQISPFSNDQDSIIADDIRIADLNRFRKLRTDGIYYEVPTSYVPYAPRAYWRVPAEHIGQRFISSIQNQKKRGQQVTNTHLETLSIMSLNHNLPQQNEAGFWITEPKSKWLYDDYGIEAGFYDTRFSTDAALFILDMYRFYNRTDKEDVPSLSLEESNQLMASLTAYADFLLWYGDRFSFVTKNGGLLLQDYHHPTIAHEPTHVSLNHLVTEMNFLLSYSLLLDNQNNARQKYPYLELASKIRTAVHDTSISWIKDNQDLWYAYMPDGRYGLMDYPRLTRNDLIISIDLLEAIYGEKDMVFKALIQSKESYLTKNNLPLW